MKMLLLLICFTFFQSPEIGPDIIFTAEDALSSCETAQVSPLLPARKSNFDITKKDFQLSLISLKKFFFAHLLNARAVITPVLSYLPSSRIFDYLDYSIPPPPSYV